MINLETLTTEVRLRDVLYAHTFESALQYLGENVLSHPDKVAKLPTSVLNFLTIIPMEYIEQAIPGYTTGDHLRKVYGQNPESFIPGKQLRNYIQFAGADTFEGLKNKFLRASWQLQDDFPQVGTDHSLPGLTAPHEQFSYDNVYDVLQIISHQLDGQTRRTGEPSLAHQLRMGLRACETIRYCNRLYAQGIPSCIFDPKGAEGLVMTYLGHDFSEDVIPVTDLSGFLEQSFNNTDLLAEEQREYIHQNAAVLSQCGHVQYINDSSEQGAYLQFIRKLCWEHGITIEQVPIEILTIPNAYQSHNNTVASIRAVDSSEQTDFTNKIRQTIRQAQREQSITTLTDLGQLLAPGFTKIEDRVDNLATYNFIKSKEGYIPAPVEKIIKKAQECLTMFPPLEALIFRAVTGGYSRIPYLDKDTQRMLNYLRQAIYVEKTEILHNFPTRIARLTLLGLTPDQIFKRRSTSGLVASI